MPDADRALGERLHATISAAKFKTRYATLGFLHAAPLDDGPRRPTAFALTALTDAEAARIAALTIRAAG